MDTQLHSSTNFLEDEILIFDFPGLPRFMYEDGGILIHVDWQRLENFERAFLRACRLRIFMNDDAQGIYAPLDDFLLIAPWEMQGVLQEQKLIMLAMIARDGGPR